MAGENLTTIVSELPAERLVGGELAMENSVDHPVSVAAMLESVAVPALVSLTRMSIKAPPIAVKYRVDPSSDTGKYPVSPSAGIEEPSATWSIKSGASTPEKVS
jgi:hypothetical protein